ncbi:uncharacterized protein EV420DRAFT_1750132 [Desarmillaria tabescens]|uniref:Uncharacterized protein n=1 Tax=Armillaria tabescens TaxID=1929756 RepID=A0AA39K1E0_ARMTA|nr:uncharacterized protein EV420DRAFT_1750132 [Desarmillaria tabescens]KAK0451374.1 hypothetical protein EV420DRAFT_1750132 [Desarmillaria tabescens]
MDILKTRKMREMANMNPSRILGDWAGKTRLPELGMFGVSPFTSPARGPSYPLPPYLHMDESPCIWIKEKVIQEVIRRQKNLECAGILMKTKWNAAWVLTGQATLPRRSRSGRLRCEPSLAVMSRCNGGSYSSILAGVLFKSASTITRGAILALPDGAERYDCEVPGLLGEYTAVNAHSRYQYYNEKTKAR